MINSVKPHIRFPNIFVLSDPTIFSDNFATVNLSPNLPQDEHFEFDEIHQVNGTEYRVWHPFQCFLASCLLGGIEEINIEPGCRVLCIGCSPLTVAACSDIVSSHGRIFSVNSARDLGEFNWEKMQSQRSNLVSICGDATKPHEYESLIEARVDVMIVNGSIKMLEENAKIFLKEGGNFLITLKKPEGATGLGWEGNLVSQIGKNFKPREMLTLEPFYRDLAVLGGSTKPKNSN